MMGDEVNPYPILLLVNYWEIRPAHMGARLDELLRKGITQFGTFIPWQAAESDISHTIMRFLQAAAERRMHVTLILSPELGVHYPYSGLPRDVLSRSENAAVHHQGKGIAVNLPPNSFPLPSYFAPEFTKRYYSFLARMDSLFADLKKNQADVLKGVTFALSGSLWKYYRSPLACSQMAFGGNAGDYSSHAAVAYRQRLEYFYSQREFMDPTPASANRWKTRSLEETNRRWFYQHSEEVFRNRSSEAIKKRSFHLPVTEVELYTPEADPAQVYSRFLQMVAGTSADFTRLSNYIDEAATRISIAAGAATAPFLHWSSMGGFRTLSDQEKQFLLLKSILLLGGQKGGILIEDSEWNSFSPGFRTRAETLIRSLSQGEIQTRNRVLYLTPHLWSHYGAPWEELSRRMGSMAKLISSLDLVFKEKNAELVIVDSTYILTQEVIQKLTGWAKSGRVVVLPRSQLYTEAARMELEKVLAQTQRIEVNLGVTYRLHALGEGKVIVHDLPAGAHAKEESLAVWQNFLNAVLSLAEIESFCRSSDSRLTLLSFEQRNEDLAVFAMNGSRRPVGADIIFPKEVEIADLGATFATGAELSGDSSPAVARSHRFSLNVPPFGILPLTIKGLNLTELREKHMAALTSEETRNHPLSVANTELPGFSLEGGLEEAWN